ncbi:Alpha/beta hydrolase family protein [Lentzea albidocapillata subsp. violacea]|uniref:Alpha/beta hydrolase family protein n=1 Tax=Lentzea albidocapillata subsp. violacea TaxID=128104 RepID=A0A1G8YZU0_9PSEU|nr:alpha/beta hydrolase [Lentzea albidocapillata]SDK07904.1 Alpha/beta hydrolase family protein [Lentzea albidocapillata subsp. violacea]
MFDGLRPAARESVIRAVLDVPRLLRHSVWRTAEPHQGNGLGVVLVPGFGAGGASLSPARSWLRARGYRPVHSGVGFTVGCTAQLLTKLLHSTERHAELTGRPVVLLGQSRGGWLARLAAARRPDLVHGLVMLGSPVLDPLGAHPSVMRIARFLARLAAAGVPGLLDDDCMRGPCFDEHMKALAEPLRVPAISIFSRLDGIVPWRLCQDPCAECVEVYSSHTGMGFDPDVYAALAPRLAAWARRDVEVNA